MSGKKPTSVNHLPVFSSIGEPQFVPRLTERKRRLVVFGTRGRRIEVYKRSTHDVNRICCLLDIQEIVDIGRSVDFDFAEALDVPVAVYGELPGDQLSSILLDAIAGVIDYPASMLGKSTIFASYCSHGVVPILAHYGDRQPSDGLVPNLHYWFTEVPTESANLRTAQVIADNAVRWYGEHNAMAHSKRLEACLASVGGHSPEHVGSLEPVAL
jgi:hypothetical protein